MVSVWFQMRFVEQLWWDDTNFFLAICCRALTPQASHSFLGFYDIHVSFGWSNQHVSPVESGIFMSLSKNGPLNQTIHHGELPWV